MQAADPTEKFVAPALKAPVPYLNFSNLQNVITALEKSANQFAELYAANPKPLTRLPWLNQLLFQAEQKLLSTNGLPKKTLV